MIADEVMVLNGVHESVRFDSMDQCATLALATNRAIEDESLCEHARQVRSVVDAIRKLFPGSYDAKH